MNFQFYIREIPILQKMLQIKFFVTNYFLRTFRLFIAYISCPSQNIVTNFQHKVLWAHRLILKCSVTIVYELQPRKGRRENNALPLLFSACLSAARMRRSDQQLCLPACSLFFPFCFPSSYQSILSPSATLIAASRQHASSSTFATHKWLLLSELR